MTAEPMTTEALAAMSARTDAHDGSDRYTYTVNRIEYDAHWAQDVRRLLAEVDRLRVEYQAAIDAGADIIRDLREARADRDALAARLDAVQVGVLDAEPTLRDVMAAAYRAGLRLRCEVDDSYTDGTEGVWRHREYAIAPFGDDGELGHLTFQTGECTTVCISTRKNQSFSTFTDPTPRQVLNAAQAAGLIGDTDA